MTSVMSDQPHRKKLQVENLEKKNGFQQDFPGNKSKRQKTLRIQNSETKTLYLFLSH